MLKMRRSGFAKADLYADSVDGARPLFEKRNLRKARTVSGTTNDGLVRLRNEQKEDQIDWYCLQVDVLRQRRRTSADSPEYN